MLGLAGLVVALAITAALGALEAITTFPARILIAIISSLVFAAVVGAGVAPVVASRRPGDYVIGAAFAVAALTCGTVVGASTSLLIESVACPNGLGECLYDWIMKPLYWVLVFGGLPALVLGSLFTFFVGRDLEGLPSASSLRPVILAAAVVILATPFMATMFLLDQTETVVREMRRVEEPDQMPDEVILVFENAPHYFERFQSENLHRWLESRDRDSVRVTFTVTRDFGSVRATRLESIEGYPGDATEVWRGGGNGCGGKLAPCSTPHESRRSPWDP